MGNKPAGSAVDRERNKIYKPYKTKIMREIEFRGKRTDTGEWVYGDLIHKHWCGGGAFVDCSIRYPLNNRYPIDNVYSFPVEVHPETVGQFTGRFDKNRIKIFEGHVLQSKFGVVVCTFEDGGFVFRQPNGSLVDSEFTIIGNIHDNPELCTTATN